MLWRSIVGSMKTEEFSLTAADGAPIQAYRWRPEGPVKAVIQIVHGMAEHAQRYARLAAAVTAKGYAVVALDLRGHGQSVVSADDLGFFAERDGWNKVVGDLATQRQWIGGDYPETPVILLGHSMGSFMAQQMICGDGDSYLGVVLSGSNGPIGPAAQVAATLARAEVMRLGPKGHSKLLAKMSFGAFNKPYQPARTDFDWLSRDPGEVDKYIADPLCGFEFCTSSWRDMFVALGRLHEKEALAAIPKALPIYIIAGANDAVSNNTKGLDKLIAAYRAAGLTEVNHRYYEGARHELLNESNRDEVTDDLLIWLENLLSKT
jgi:alpha-beta hydrolase superfamily lysophospholipase